ncbi:hypothetical protein MHZ93_04835 [Roseomonas sp. ACRSG]|nr:hypothetical protein [Roseomonas sp. ACRSG]
MLVLFTATGNQIAMPEGAAVAAVTTLGYAWVLAGSVGIGFAAHVNNLPTALLVVAAMLLSVAAFRPRVQM